MNFASLLLLATLAASPGQKVWSAYESTWAVRLTPMLSEVLRFSTVAGDTAAFDAQRAWLHKVGGQLDFVVRDTPTVIEIELPGPPGSPVLGLMVHGDVQPVNASEWSVPPFSGTVKDGAVWGRGAADDKGPLVQALLAMASLRSAGLHRTHTVRLLVGTDEESGADDVDIYQKSHPAPDYTLVLDNAFPVVVGEKAWAEYTVSAHEHPAGSGPVEVVDLTAGQSTSIVPDLATLAVRWRAGTPQWDGWLAPIRAARLPEGTSLEARGTGPERTLVAHGRAAHAGTSLAMGRNALVALATAVDGHLPASAAADLLAYARQAGEDTHGTGLGLTQRDPLWGSADTNVARVQRNPQGLLTLFINVRSPPQLWGEALRAKLDVQALPFAARRGGRFETGGKFGYAPFQVDSDSPLVRRLLDDYARATGKGRGPVVSAGGSYAQRLPSAVAFGMWFEEDGAYPGHASNERISVAALTRGMRVLTEALGDLATGPRLDQPLRRIEFPPQGSGGSATRR
jgi:succinyl-diaminopimelate desuccinylase